MTELAENHHALVSQGLLLKHTIKLTEELMLAANDVDADFPDILQLSYGNMKMSKSLSSIFLNLCRGGPQVQSHVLSHGTAQLLLQALSQVNDYEMHCNLYQALTHLVLSLDSTLATQAVKLGCLKEIINAADNSHIFKVRRLCSSALESVPPQLIELNSRIKTKKRGPSKQTTRLM